LCHRIQNSAYSKKQEFRAQQDREKKLIEGSCHCGAIRFTVSQLRDWLTRCNCSYCRRTGGLWLHAPCDKVSVTYDRNAVVRYIQGDRTLANITCATCGCTTHWEPLNPHEVSHMGVNCNMSPPEQIAGMRIRHFDGAEAWEYLD
jgi:hypothetical protein